MYFIVLWCSSFSSTPFFWGISHLVAHPWIFFSASLHWLPAPCKADSWSGAWKPPALGKHSPKSQCKSCKKWYQHMNKISNNVTYLWKSKQLRFKLWKNTGIFGTFARASDISCRSLRPRSSLKATCQGNVSNLGHGGTKGVFILFAYIRMFSPSHGVPFLKRCFSWSGSDSATSKPFGLSTGIPWHLLLNTKKLWRKTTAQLMPKILAFLLS